MITQILEPTKSLHNSSIEGDVKNLSMKTHFHMKQECHARLDLSRNRSSQARWDDGSLVSTSPCFHFSNGLHSISHPPARSIVAMLYGFDRLSDKAKESDGSRI
jgi:hypothetical protein